MEATIITFIFPWSWIKGCLLYCQCRQKITTDIFPNPEKGSTCSVRQAECTTSQMTKLKASQWKEGTNKSASLLWSDVFGGNLLGKMLIYPLHCRLLPTPFKMWLFSDAQGNFDPLRLLWSEAPFNRSSAQEFKLILSLPTTGSPQRFGVKVKALPRCQSCWQPAHLKAPSNAADQRDSVLMGGANTVAWRRKGLKLGPKFSHFV